MWSSEALDIPSWRGMAPTFPSWGQMGTSAVTYGLARAKRFHGARETNQLCVCTPILIDFEPKAVGQREAYSVHSCAISLPFYQIYIQFLQAGMQNLDKWHQPWEAEQKLTHSDSNLQKFAEIFVGVSDGWIRLFSRPVTWFTFEGQHIEFAMFRACGSGQQMDSSMMCLLLCHTSS